MREVAADILRDLGAALVALDGEADHVHLLLRYPPTLLLSVLVGRTKGATSRVLRQRYRLRPHPRHFWSPPGSTRPAVVHHLSA